MHVRKSLYIIHYFKMHEKCICEVYTSGKRPGVANDLFDYAKPNPCVLDRGLYHCKERFNAYDRMTLTSGVPRNFVRGGGGGVF